MKRKLEFISSIECEDFDVCVDILPEYGIGLDKAKSVVQDVCKTFFHVEIPDAFESITIHTTLQGDEITKAEKVLVDAGLSKDKAQIALQELCHILVDMEIYEDDSDEYSVW